MTLVPLTWCDENQCMSPRLPNKDRYIALLTTLLYSMIERSVQSDNMQDHTTANALYKVNNVHSNKHKNGLVAHQARN